MAVEGALTSSAVGGTSSGAALGFALTFVDGRGVLTLDEWALDSVGLINHIELEIPHLRFPFDLSGGAGRFQHRRLKLKELLISTDAGALGAYARVLPLGDFGLSEPRVELAGGVLRLAAKAAMGGHEAFLTARSGFADASGAVRLSLYDVRVYGFLPIPAPLVATAFLRALGSDSDWVRVAGLAQAELDLLDLILLELMVAQGWRLPDRAGAEVVAVPAMGDRLMLRFRVRAEGADVDAAPVGSEAFVEDERGRRQLDAVERMLAAGDVPGALVALRAMDPVGCGARFAAGRLLAVLAAHDATLDEAEERAGAALERWPDFVPGWLAKGTAAAARGRPVEAAEAYERLALLANAEGASLDVAASLVAAAGQRARAGDAGAATRLLEQALAARPDHAEAARRLAESLASQGRWHDLLRVLRQQALEEPDITRRARFFADIGFVYLDRLNENARARERFEQAVRVCEREPAGWEGLGRAQALVGEREAAHASLAKAHVLYAERGDAGARARVDVALASLDDTAGDEGRAMARLLEAAVLNPHAVEPLRLAAEMAARAKRFGEAARHLESAFSRAVSREERLLLVRRLAALHADDLSDPVSARMLLERALAEHPADLGLLDHMGHFFARQGEPAEWEPFLRRALSGSQSPEDRRAVLGRMRDLAKETGQHALLIEALRGLLREGGAERATAALEVAERVHEIEDLDIAAAAADVLQSLLANGTTVSGTARAELARRLATLREKQGDEDGALAWLRVCLEGDAEGTVAVSAWRRFIEMAARRGDAGAAAQALVAWADDPRTREGDCDRAAHLVAAAEIFRGRLGMVDDAVAVLERAAGLDPLNDAVYDTLENLARDREDWVRVADILVRRIELARVGEQPRVLQRMAEVLERLGRQDEARSVYRRLLDAAPTDLAVRLGLARLLWRTGDQDESAAEFRRLLESLSNEPLLSPSGAAAEAALRLAQWARSIGQGEDADRYLKTALDGEPALGAPLVVLVEVLEALGSTDELLRHLEGRESLAVSGEARTEVALARAGVMQRAGRSAEAVTIYEALLASAPDDPSLLEPLAEIFRRSDVPQSLVSVLERLLVSPKAALIGIDQETIGIELAAVYRERLVGTDRAEAILRQLLEHNPSCSEALGALSSVLFARGAYDEADALLMRRAEVEGDRVIVARFLVQRAEARLALGGGELAALALLRRADFGALSVDGLSVCADVAERLGEIADAMAALKRLRVLTVQAGDRAQAASIARRIESLAIDPGLEPMLGAEIFEERLGAHGGDVVAAESLVEIYGRLPDTAARNRAWASLLDRVPEIAEPTRARMLVALAEEAEQKPDIPRALDLYDTVLSLASDPPVRVRSLVGHARILIDKRDMEEGLADLDEALALAPTDATALVLRADLAYRNQDWEQARLLYARLAAAPGAALVIAMEELAFRRAELAEMFGDEAEAEAGYREVASTNPSHLEAREALAQFALYRGELADAGRWFEEVLRVLPLDAAEKIREIRLRLGDIYGQLGEAEAARRFLELVIAEEPNREAALEILVTVYQKLGLAREAAILCGRLSRLYTDPDRRAEALYRQGEILRTSLGDLAAANDAYLRSSDLDPGFAPTLIRLVFYYWDEGDYGNLVEVGSTLVRSLPPERLAEEDVGLLVALGAATSGKDDAVARAALHVPSLMPENTAVRLAQLAQRLGCRTPDSLDPALRLLTELTPPQFIDALTEHLARKVVVDPAEITFLVTLGRLAESRGDSVTTRAAYGLLLFLDPNFPVSARFVDIGESTAPTPAAWLPGAALHPLARGPLRRVLVALGPLLAGCPKLADLGETVTPLDGDLAAMVSDLSHRLAAPPVMAVVDPEGEEVQVLATGPLTVAVGARVRDLARAEMVFMVARALEDARSGTFLVKALPTDGVVDMLRGAMRVLAPAAAPDSAVATAKLGDVGRLVAAHLGDPAMSALLPTGDERGALRDALAQTLAQPSEIDDYRLGARLTADRLGALVCGSPVAALRVVSGAPVLSLSREESLRSSPVLRDLIAFMFSNEYKDLMNNSEGNT